MPVEMRVEMYPEKEVVLPRFTGYVSRGLLLHMLKRVDPGIAQRLHEPDKMKPYSVTRLMFRSRGKTPEGYVVDPSYPCSVAFRFLDDAYARALLGYFTEMAEVTILDTTCRIASIAVHAKDYREIEAEAKPLRSFTLVFESPTYLSSMGASYRCLFPEPVRLFSNLMRLWSCFSTSRRYTKEEHATYKDWLGKHIGVSQYRLKTVFAHMRKKKAPGFQGWVTYEMDRNDDWNKVTIMLAQFAQYSNTGGNRTAGFGETRHQPATEWNRE
ncbi:MAG: CRISPR-associated endoribonuclease Cas6 [Candidatus Bathyarchaeia archaeon]